jgi:hypothetical protein
MVCGAGGVITVFHRRGVAWSRFANTAAAAALMKREIGVG